MPAARFTFSCDTGDDWDVIEWLESFIVKERGMAIKAAIRQFQEVTEPQLASDDRLGDIEKLVKEVLNEVAEIRRGGVVMKEKKTQDSNNKKEISEEELSKIEANLKRFA